jgi:hypothetical protein
MSTNTLQDNREVALELLTKANAMDKDTNALEVLNIFRQLRFSLIELENAIMSDIFPKSKENN